MTLDLIRHLNNLIAEKKYFAAWRFPNEKEVHVLEAASAKIIRQHEIGLEKGFIAFPFSEDEGILLSEKHGNFELPQLQFSYRSTSRKNYFDRTEKFISAIRNKEFGKLVLSRIIEIETPTSFQPDSMFFQLCEAYPNAFINCIHLPGWGFWMGASPEILLNSFSDSITIMSLAGTQSLSDKKDDEIVWGEKEIEEQKIVTDSISHQLESIPGIEFSVGEVHNHRAGHLIHLRTNIEIKKDSVTHLAPIIKLLHPTPAVGGFPKEKSIEYIRQNEGHQRGLYAGFLGPVNSVVDMKLFVNLRCMHFNERSIFLFAGGGLTAASDPDKEWEETEQKSNVLLKFIQ